MLSNYMKDTVQIVSEQLNWDEAIAVAYKPLLAQNKISDSYVENVIKSVKENGPYIVILPNIALPHTRSNGDVNEVCISVTKFANKVQFPENKDVDLMFSIASPDAEGHMELIGELGDLLMEDEIIEGIRNANSVDEIRQHLGI